MRNYEIMYIVRPDLTDEDLDKLVETMSGHATQAGATVKSAEKMGKRRLSYSVKGCRDGNYILLTLQADGKAVHEVERRLRVAEQVIKFLTIRMDDEIKRMDKHHAKQAQRAAHAAAKLPPADATPAPVAEIPAAAAISDAAPVAVAEVVAAPVVEATVAEVPVV